MIFESGHFNDDIIQKSVINEFLTESRTFSEKHAAKRKKTVFLSHKHPKPDDEAGLRDLGGVMGFLEDLGASIYIDARDNRMQGQTTGATAARIKEIIKASNKFILYATEKAIASYWCNWELGFGDTYKFIDNIAILPQKDTGTSDATYKGNEYLQIYPRIDYQDGTTRYASSNEIIPEGYYIVKPPNDKGTKIITLLRDWINR